MIIYHRYGLRIEAFGISLFESGSNFMNHFIKVIAERSKNFILAYFSERNLEMYKLGSGETQ